MRRLTPYNYPAPLPCLLRFYSRHYRDARDLNEVHGLQRPGSASMLRVSWWRRLFGR